MKFSIILLSAVFVFSSCKSSTTEENKKEEAVNPMNIQPDAPVFQNRSTVQERYENGAPRILGDFDNEGNRHGLWTFYFDNGFEERVQDYSHGKLNGMFLQFHNQTGKIILRGQYNKGKKVGVWTEYYPTGQILKIDTIQ